MENIKERSVEKHRNYLALAKFLDTSLLGLLAGMISGIAINILTGDSLPILSWIAIVLIIVSVVFIVRLIRVRMEIDAAYTSREGQGLKPHVRWRASVDPDNTERKAKFFSAIIGVPLFLAMGLVFNYQANQKNEDEMTVKFDSLNNQIKKLEDTIRSMEMINRRILFQIESNTDSIRRWHK